MSASPSRQVGDGAPAREPIRVFSDLHLGHPGCRVKSVAALRPLFEGAGMVIFNGDTAEQRHSQLKGEGELQRTELEDLLSELGVPALFLRGNHDPEISDRDHVELAEGRILVTHGDAVFRHLSPWSPEIWKVIPQMEALREEMGESAVQSELEACLAYVHRSRYLPKGGPLAFRKTGPFPRLASILRLAWPPARPLKILHTWATIPRRAHAFLGNYRPDAQVLLFGHTHLAGRWRKGARSVINTGGFVSYSPARCVELQNGTLALRKVEEKEGESYALGESVVELELR